MPNPVKSDSSNGIIAAQTIDKFTANQLNYLISY
jgi:hypothetical protein